MRDSAEHRGGQKLRYYTAAAAGVLLLCAAGALLWYMLIYSTKRVSTVEIEFTGDAIILSDHTEEAAVQLKGQLFRDVDKDQVRRALLEHGELADARLTISYPGTAHLKLTAKTPLGIVRITRGVVSELVLFTDGSLAAGYERFSSSAAVPVVETAADDLVQDDGYIIRQLEDFFVMLQQLYRYDPALFGQLSRIYYDLQGEHELDAVIQTEQGLLVCTIPVPMGGGRLGFMLTAVVSAGMRESSPERIRATLMEDYAVLSSRY